MRSHTAPGTALCSGPRLTAPSLLPNRVNCVPFSGSEGTLQLTWSAWSADWVIISLNHLTTFPVCPLKERLKIHKIPIIR